MTLSGQISPLKKSRTCLKDAHYKTTKLKIIGILKKLRFPLFMLAMIVTLCEKDPDKKKLDSPTDVCRFSWERKREQEAKKEVSTKERFEEIAKKWG